MEKDKNFEIQKIILGFFLTTVLGTLITLLVIYLNFRYEYEQNLIVTEKKEAQEHFGQISSQMDTKLYKMRKVLWAYKDSLPADEIEKRWADYSGFLFEWNNHLNKNRALVKRYFGENIQTEYDQLNSCFSSAGDLLEKVKKSNGQNESFLNQAEELINQFNPDIYFFNIQVLNLIENEEIGRFKDENKKVNSPYRGTVGEVGYSFWVVSIFIMSLIYLMSESWAKKALNINVCAVTYENAKAALDKISSWTTWLTGIQTASMAAMIILKKDILLTEDQKTYGFFVLLFFGASIILATWLLASLPSVQQRLIRANAPHRRNDIYAMRIFTFIPFSVGRFSGLIHTYFLLGIIFFALFIFSLF